VLFWTSIKEVKVPFQMGTVSCNIKRGFPNYWKLVILLFTLIDIQTKHYGIEIFTIYNKKIIFKFRKKVFRYLSKLNTTIIYLTIRITYLS
jgi:hypothetical protein